MKKEEEGKERNQLCTPVIVVVLDQLFQVMAYSKDTLFSKNISCCQLGRSKDKVNFECASTSLFAAKIFSAASGKSMITFSSRMSSIVSSEMPIFFNIQGVTPKNTVIDPVLDCEYKS